METERKREEQREKRQSVFAMSSKRSGWFPVGSHYDSLISRQASATQTSTKCWFNSIRLISYTGDPVVVGRSDWRRRTNTLSNTHNKSGLYFLMLSLSYYSVHSSPCVLLFACTVRLHLCGCVWETAQALPRMCDFTMHSSVCVCGSWHRSRPIGGLALTRMSPQAPVLVGCLVLALHVSWLSAVRLYPTLGRLPGGGAILPSPWTSHPTPPHPPRPPIFLTD